MRAEITIIDQDCSDTLKLSRVGSTIFMDQSYVTQTPIAQAISISLPGLTISPDEMVLSGEMEHRLGVGTIEMPVSSKFRIVTDNKQDMLYLHSDKNTRRVHLCRDRSGLRLMHDVKVLRVLLVARNSPAEWAGWKVGEMIESVDGRLVDGAYWNDTTAQWHERPAGTKVVP